MDKDIFPIEASVLKWARLRSGLSLDAAAASFAKYGDWEKGLGGPTYPQLEKMAILYKLPVAVFFFPEPPEEPPIEETFRTLPGTTLSSLPGKIKFLIRKAKAFQINLSELYGGRNPAERNITKSLRFDLGESPTRMAEQVRAFMGITIVTQKSWGSDEAALKNWRHTLETLGVFVFKDSFEESNFSGFCLSDNEFPLIYVNNNCAKTRQIFTLFHELAHLLFETSGIDSVRELPARKGASEQIEVLCNAFASEFLVPSAALKEARADRPATEALAVELASLFAVSREVIYRKFLDRREISLASYNEAIGRWNEVKKSRPGGSYYNTKFAYLGAKYIGKTLSEYRQERISERQAADYLDIKPRSLLNLEEKYLKSGT